MIVVYSLLWIGACGVAGFLVGFHAAGGRPFWRLRQRFCRHRWVMNFEWGWGTDPFCSKCGKNQ